MREDSRSQTQNTSHSAAEPDGSPVPAGARHPLLGETDAALSLSHYLGDIAAADPSRSLEIAVVCDTSESMAHLTGPMASLAWVMIRAAQQLGERRTVWQVWAAAWETTESEWVSNAPFLDYMYWTPFYEPSVPILSVTDRPVPLDAAVREAMNTEGVLGPPPARLLVLITDARAETAVLDRTAEELRRIRGRGVAVVWLRPATPPGVILPGTALVIDPHEHLHPGVLGDAIRAEHASTNPATANPASSRSAVRSRRHTGRTD